MPAPAIVPTLSRRLSMDQKPLRRHTRHFLARIPAILSVFVAFFLLVTWSEILERPIYTSPPWKGAPFALPEYIARSLGPYSPWFPVEYYEPPPATCNITQVHILQRHGARYPTTGMGQRIRSALMHVRGLSRFKNQTLSFLSHYSYRLGTDDLLPYGASESYTSGVAAYNRYSHLAHQAPPFIRSTDSKRVAVSASNWRKGFQTAGRLRVRPALLMSKSPDSNNTLSNSQCPSNTHDLADHATRKWVSIFAPSIAARINEDAEGATVIPEDIPYLMSLCSFETLAYSKTSPWCWVFRPEEWAAFEYYADLEKYYFTGPGNSLGRPQGIGYINELIARLTITPVNDTTQTNHTLTSNPRTFPLNRTIYADFTHDNQMAAIFAAMGLFREEQNIHHQNLQQHPLPTSSLNPEMDPKNPNANRKWMVSSLVPFAGRMVVEKLACGPDAEQGVRILVNDAVVPLPNCPETLGAGICELSDFLKTQAYARSGGLGEWRNCSIVETV